MIKQTFLFPQFYIHKEPYCDDCNIKLEYQNRTIMSDSPVEVYKCSRCGREHNINSNDLRGEWRWRNI